MQDFTRQIPTLKIALALIAGIGSYIFTDSILRQTDFVLLIMIGLVVMCSTVLLIIQNIKNVTLDYRLRVANGISITLLILSFGYILTWLYSDKNTLQNFSKTQTKESFLLATIIKPPLQKEKVLTVVAQVIEVRNMGLATTVSGNILLKILRDSLSNEIKYGSVIVFKSNIQEFEEPKNPGEFNFKLYQSFHNIYYRSFLKTGDWKLVKQNNGNLVMSNVYQLRAYFLSLLEKYVKDKNDFAVAAAIMLGYNDYMNGDIMRAYSSSGALHVLSVSGLHVGIMFLMLNFLLQWMDNKGRKYVVAKAIIIILFIWFYACLTGLSPSVLRSAMMFSLIQLGKVLIRHVNTYNVIFASALILMLFNPFIITEVGFRLSYLAVIGIVYLHPKISSLWIIGTENSPLFKEQKKSWLKPFTFLRYDLYWFMWVVIDWCWQIISVSLAAQIATCALSLLYFHQFPNLFLISNLIVIPFSNFILFIGTALIAVGEIPHINDVFGWCFSHLLSVLNQFIFYIDSLPFALVEGISIQMYEMIALYLVLALLCIFIYENKRPVFLIGCLFIVAMLCANHSYHVLQQSVQKKVVVYCVPKQRAVAFIDGSKVIYNFDAGLADNASSMLFHVKHHWWESGINQEIKAENTNFQLGNFEFGTLYEFKGKKILLVDTVLPKVKFKLNKKLKVDLVILSHNPKVYLENLYQLVDFNEIVFDSSNKPGKIKYWISDCNKLKIQYWDVLDKDAYIMDLE